MVEIKCQVVEGVTPSRLRHAALGVVFTLVYGVGMTGDVLINLRAPAELRRAAVQAAKESGTTVSDICRDALTVFVAVHVAAGPAPVVEVVAV